MQKFLERESLKEEMVLCLMELVKDHHTEGQLETDYEHQTDLIDRGGLWHVRDTTYRLFYAIEHVIREVLMSIKHPSQPLNIKPSCSKQQNCMLLYEDFQWQVDGQNSTNSIQKINTVHNTKVSEENCMMHHGTTITNALYSYILYINFPCPL